VANEKKTKLGIDPASVRLACFFGADPARPVGGGITTQGIVISSVGFAMLVWGFVLYYRKKSSKETDKNN
jgi:hypothetical protein